MIKRQGCKGESIMHLKNLIAFGMIALVINSLNAIADQKPVSPVTLESFPKATIGFPVVVKMNVEGAHTVSYTTIFDKDFCITVHFISKSDGKIFSINSYRSIARLYFSTRGGGISREEIRGVPALVVPKEQKYTMMLDIWSLSPRDTNGTCLADIPAGKYSMFIEFLGVPAGERNIDNAPYTDKLNTNSIDIEIIEPTEQEKQFIKNIHDSNAHVSLRDGVSWVEVLRQEAIIPNEGMTSLTQVSKDQISFHKLISDVNLSDENSRNKSIKDVNDAILPNIFEPERQLLLLELKENPLEEHKRLLQKYPQMTGLIERLDLGEGFLRYKSKKKNNTIQNTVFPK